MQSIFRLACRKKWLYFKSFKYERFCFIHVWTVNEKEIVFEIIVEDKFPNNDIETDGNKWNVELVFYGNDKEHLFNADVCNILKELSNNLFDLESYSITKEQFDSMKNKSVDYYSLPLTKKEFEELSRDEILKKRIEYLKENNLL